MKKKILALVGPFVPTNEPMTLLPYKHLRKLEADIDVLSLQEKEDLSLKEKLLCDPEYKKFNIYTIGKYNDALFSIRNINLYKALKNIKKYKEKALSTWKSGNYDLVYSSSFPLFTHEAALQIKKEDNAFWIASFTDPINHSPYKEDEETYRNYSLPEKIAFKFYCRYYVKDEVEKDVFENADILIFICEEQKYFMLEQYEKYYGNVCRDELEKKSLILPLNYIKEWEKRKLNPLKETEKIILSHFGRVYGLRKIDNFIKALSLVIKDNPQLKSKVIVEQYGEFRKKDRKLIQQFNLTDNFKISDKIPYEECIQKMNQSHALLVFDTIMPEESWQPYLPSKILEYSLLKKNVFAITTKKSPTYRIMRSSNGLAALDNVEDIKENLIELFKGKKSVLEYHHENSEIGQSLENKINDLLK